MYVFEFSNDFHNFCHPEALVPRVNFGIKRLVDLHDFVIKNGMHFRDFGRKEI